MKDKAGKIFVDMDGVIANFELGMIDSGNLSAAEYKLMTGAYLFLQPYQDGLDALRILEPKWDIWIATKIPHANPHAATEKLLWIEKYLPEYITKTIITPNKGTLGGFDDYLIDDRPHKAYCSEFQGTFLNFGRSGQYKTWADVLEFFEVEYKRRIDENRSFEK